MNKLIFFQQTEKITVVLPCFMRVECGQAPHNAAPNKSLLVFLLETRRYDVLHSRLQYMLYRTSDISRRLNNIYRQLYLSYLATTVCRCIVSSVKNYRNMPLQDTGGCFSCPHRVKRSSISRSIFSTFLSAKSYKTIIIATQSCTAR